MIDKKVLTFVADIDSKHTVRNYNLQRKNGVDVLTVKALVSDNVMMFEYTDVNDFTYQTVARYFFYPKKIRTKKKYLTQLLDK